MTEKKPTKIIGDNAGRAKSYLEKGVPHKDEGGDINVAKELAHIDSSIQKILGENPDRKFRKKLLNQYDKNNPSPRGGNQRY